MPTSKTSEAKAKVSLDSSEFAKSAKEISTAAQEMSASIAAAFATAGTAMLAVFGAETVSAIVGQIKSVIDLGEEMANAGKKAGLAAGNFYLFHNAVEKGLSLSTVAALLGDNAEVLNQSASVFRDVAIKLWVIGEKIKGFWLGLVDRLAPVLSRLLDGTLAISLVSAGQAFGDAIANVFKVIYQLAKDGKIWSTLMAGFKIVFDYVGELLIWLAGTSYRLFAAVFSGAISDGIDAAIPLILEKLQSLFDTLGDWIGEKITQLVADFYSAVANVLNLIDTAKNKVGLLSDQELADNKKARGGVTDTLNQVAFGSGKSDVDRAGEFAKKIAEIISSNKFTGSKDLASEIDKFKTAISGALTDFNKDAVDNPPTTFENNNRQKAFGVDSLAAIGAGGNVYLGLSVLDVNKQQLVELKLIRQEISKQRDPAVQRRIDNYMPFTVSREQSLSTVN